MLQHEGRPQPQGAPWYGDPSSGGSSTRTRPPATPHMRPLQRLKIQESAQESCSDKGCAWCRTQNTEEQTGSTVGLLLQLLLSPPLPWFSTLTFNLRLSLFCETLRPLVPLLLWEASLDWVPREAYAAAMEELRDGIGEIWALSCNAVCMRDVHTHVISVRKRDRSVVELASTAARCPTRARRRRPILSMIGSEVSAPLR